MAVIDSILIGKGRGKLGNVILQRYAGKTIARSKNSLISVPATQLQLNQRAKFINAKLAWSYWQSHYDLLQGLSYRWRKSQNIFFKLFTDKFPVTVLTTENELYTATTGASYGKGNLCEVVAANFAQQGIDIEVIPYMTSPLNDLYVNVMLHRFRDNRTFIQKVSCDIESYLSGFIFVAIPNVYWNVFSVYLSANGGSSTSNIRT